MADDGHFVAVRVKANALAGNVVDDNRIQMLGCELLARVQALVRMSGGPGGRFDINKLSEADAEELSRLCDALALENSHEWGNGD